MRLPILMYHSVLPVDKINSILAQRKSADYIIEDVVFEKQIEYLDRNGYSTISFTDIERHLNFSCVLPPKPVILTFDDGTIDNYDVAFSILRKFGFKATFFIVTNMVGRKGFLGWREIREMSEGGMEIQSHTHTHCDLGKISDQEIETELKCSKDIIEQNLNTSVNVLALPHGRGNLDPIRSISSRCGYSYVCTSEWGGNNLRKGIYCFKRFNVGPETTFAGFCDAVELSTMLLLFYRLRKAPIYIAKRIFGDKYYGSLRNIILKKP